MNELIINQTKVLLKNIQTTLDYISDDFYYKKINGFLVWKQAYHQLNSLDRNFIYNPDYEYPSFHTEGLNKIEHENNEIIEKKVLLDYFSKIRKDIELYLESLDDSQLAEKIKFMDMELTRFDMILAQFRHVMWHIGFLHCSIKLDAGTMPEYIGLY